MSNSLRVAHLSWAIWANRSQLLIWFERMSDEQMSEWANERWAKEWMSEWANERWANERIPSPGKYEQCTSYLIVEPNKNLYYCLVHCLKGIEVLQGFRDTTRCSSQYYTKIRKAWTNSCSISYPRFTFFPYYVHCDKSIWRSGSILCYSWEYYQL